jgi:hypothetical protein
MVDEVAVAVNLEFAWREVEMLCRDDQEGLLILV